MMPKLPAARNLLILLAGLLLAALLYAAASAIVSSQNYHNSDFFTLWLGGRMVATGQDPYDSQAWLAGHQQQGVTWIPNQTYIYPLPLAMLFIPLSLMPFGQAYVLWVFLSGWMVIGAVLLALKTVPVRGYGHLLMPAMLGTVLFRPVILALRNGQLSAALLLALALAVYLWEREKWAAGGVFFSLLLLKPNLGLPIAGLMCAWLLLRGRVRPAAIVAGVGMLSWLPGFLLDPLWAGHFLFAGAHKFFQTFGYSPTVWGIARTACRGEYTCTLAAGAVASGLLAAGVLLIVRGFRSPAAAASVLVPVALLVTPYIWNYDQSLLVAPVVFCMARMLGKGRPYLLAALPLLSLSVLAVGLLLIALQVGMDAWSAGVPLASLLLALVVQSAAAGLPVCNLKGGRKVNRLV